jgi:carboxymethylenebutenolidase
MPHIARPTVALGYCLGGWLTYMAAAHHIIDAGVSYYGGGIEDALELSSEISVPMQFHFGKRISTFPSH